MASLYILKLVDNSYYVGSTGNLTQRLNNHYNGEVKSTKHKLPFVLIYTENYNTKSEAQKREYQIKRWKKRVAIERLLKK